MCDTFTGGMDIFWYRGIEKSLRRRFDAGGSLLLFFLPNDPLIGEVFRVIGQNVLMKTALQLEK